VVLAAEKSVAKLLELLCREVRLAQPGDVVVCGRAIVAAWRAVTVNVD
jgi:hypothetical protein